jgi:CheY-like chemotaxis protein
MRMSGMNGAELCKRLRKSTPDGVKFFVLTAQALPEERENLLSLGFDGYLMKPFHSTELLELAGKLLACGAAKACRTCRIRLFYAE